MEAKIWWIVHGAYAPTLQKITLKLLGQPCSSSCCERNWDTYSFIHSLERNKMTPKREEDLVFVHNNLLFLSKNFSKYKKEEIKLWNQNTKKRKVNYGILQEMTFHWMTMKFLRFPIYLLMNQT